MPSQLPFPYGNFCYAGFVRKGLKHITLLNITVMNDEPNEPNKYAETYSDTELVYTGKCADIVAKLDRAIQPGRVLIRDDEHIQIKPGTRPFLAYYELYYFYPIHFQCSDKVKPPKGKFVAGKFSSPFCELKRV